MFNKESRELQSLDDEGGKLIVDDILQALQRKII